MEKLNTPFKYTPQQCIELCKTCQWSLYVYMYMYMYMYMYRSARYTVVLHAIPGVYSTCTCTCTQHPMKCNCQIMDSPIITDFELGHSDHDYTGKHSLQYNPINREAYWG